MCYVVDTMSRNIFEISSFSYQVLICVVQELVLRYESLSLAVAAVAAGSVALPAATHPQIGAHQAGLPVPQTAFAHLLSGGHPAAHSQQAAVVQLPVGRPLETAPTPGTALALDEASVTAEDAAEKVLKPSTSAGLYDDPRLQLPEQAGPPSASAAGDLPASAAAPPHANEAGSERGGNAVEAEFVQAMALQDDDRYLSLATGEAQADAEDVRTPDAGATAAADFSVAGGHMQLPTLQEVNDPVTGQAPGKDAKQGDHPASHDEDDDVEEVDVPGVSDEDRAGSHEAAAEELTAATEPRWEAGGAAEHPSSAGEPIGDFVPGPGGIQSRMSISSTAATVGDRASMDISRLDFNPADSSSVKSDAGASSVAATEPAESPGRAPDAAGFPSANQRTHSRAFDEGMPATSSDGDPFYATDLALKVSTAQTEVGRSLLLLTCYKTCLRNLPVNFPDTELLCDAVQKLAGSAGSPKQLALAENNKHDAADAAADDLFGGLSVAHAPAEGQHEPASSSLI